MITAKGGATEDADEFEPVVLWYGAWDEPNAKDPLGETVYSPPSVVRKIAQDNLDRIRKFHPEFQDFRMEYVVIETRERSLHCQDAPKDTVLENLLGYETGTLKFRTM